ncbi:2'-5' RNA ligase family protein [Streptomyces sp. NPDC006552]|uniref:2'-5' RNA ligase family protein n=1 Tax=Streptomyces sp. NPDC006552 TaxID=3157179 RepID=UPI0033BD5891
MTRWLGVALLPRADHLRAAIRIQRALGTDHGLQPPLAPDGNLPHVTVFQGPFAESLVPEQDLERIGTALSLPAELHLGFTGIHYQPTGWVFLGLTRPPVLDTLQETTLAVLTPHLDRSAFDTTKDTSQYTEAERTSYARYGYRYTGAAYAPHITLGRTGEQAARTIVDTASTRTEVAQDWVFDRMSCYVMGENGAHARVLAERPLNVP